MSGQTKLLLPSGGSVTIAGQDSASNFVATLPANTGTVVTTGSTAVVSQAMLGANVAGNGPAFSAYQSSGQSLSAAVYTKIQFQTEEFDTNSNYDNVTNFRFTPTVAGYYQIIAGFALNTSRTGMRMNVYKNGSVAKAIAVNTDSTTSFISGTALFYANGSTDYFEIYGVSDVTQNTYPGSAATFFQAFLARAA